VEIQKVCNGKHPKRIERSINVQWTFIANGPACSRCLDAIVKYNLEFKKIKISLDFCLFSSMEKKEERVRKGR
jgi:hypothetical protein